MKRVISYSLFWCGKDSHANLYTNGIPAICRAHHTCFPGWEWRVYHDGSLDNNLQSAWLRAYEKAGLVTLVDMGPDEVLCRAMLRRMSPAFDTDVEVFLCRDMDSLPTPRERRMVDQFLGTHAAMHVISDHPQHSAALMGGLCGFRSDPFRRLMGWSKLEHMTKAAPLGTHGDDQLLLAQRVWPKLEHSLCEHRLAGRALQPGSFGFKTVPVTDLHDVPPEVSLGGDGLLLFLGQPGFDPAPAIDFYNRQGDPDTMRRIQACEQ